MKKYYKIPLAFSNQNVLNIVIGNQIVLHHFLSHFVECNIPLNNKSQFINDIIFQEVTSF